MNALGNFYFVGQAAGMVEANLTNKPFGKTIEDPLIQTASIAMRGVSELLSGEVAKGMDSGIQTAFRTKGLPLFPYMNFVRKPLKSMGE